MVSADGNYILFRFRGKHPITACEVSDRERASAHARPHRSNVLDTEEGEEPHERDNVCIAWLHSLDISMLRSILFQFGACCAFANSSNFAVIKRSQGCFYHHAFFPFRKRYNLPGLHAINAVVYRCCRMETTYCMSKTVIFPNSEKQQETI